MILGRLGRDLGRRYSIRGLTDELRKDGFSAYYKNVFDRIAELRREGIVTIEKAGRSSLVSLDLSNCDTLILLSEIELLGKRKLLEKDLEQKMLVCELCSGIRERFCLVDSVSMIRPGRNKALNRAEFLLILRGDRGHMGEAKGIRRFLAGLGRAHNMSIDSLILGAGELSDLVKENAHNPLKEMLSDKVVVYGQENFWLMIKELAGRGVAVGSSEEMNPAKISEKDLRYNLARFGYREMGGALEKGKEYCIETVIISLLLSADARRIEAIPAILAKNLGRERKPVWSLLIFLGEKYGKEGKLLSLLKSLEEYSGKGGVREAVSAMDDAGIRPERIDRKAVREKIELYDGNKRG